MKQQILNKTNRLQVLRLLNELHKLEFSDPSERSDEEAMRIEEIRLTVGLPSYFEIEEDIAGAV